MDNIRTTCGLLVALLLLGCGHDSYTGRGVCILGPSTYEDGRVDNSLSVVCWSPHAKTLRVEHGGEVHGPWSLPAGKAQMVVSYAGGRLSLIGKDDSRTVAADFATDFENGVISNRVESGRLGLDYRVEIIGVNGLAQTNLLVLLLDFP
jgi:hypothetical protein